MSKQHFNPPSKHAMKNKLISALCLALIIISLYSTCYLLFFRTTGIDVTKDVEIMYRGENGSATVIVRNKNLNYNQRIQEFMDTVTYKISPDKNLSNGDLIEIEASYDETLASRYHINATHLSKMIMVSNLPVRYESIKEIPKTLLDTIDESSEKYLKKNMTSILEDDFTNFYFNSEPELKEYQRVYRVFLNSRDNETRDKILDIYAITAIGEVNVSSKEEKLEKKEVTIYYMITYNEINTSGKILNEDVYGEKIITDNKVNLQKEADFTKYMNSKYKEVYTIEQLK